MGSNNNSLSNNSSSNSTIKEDKSKVVKAVIHSFRVKISNNCRINNKFQANRDNYIKDPWDPMEIINFRTII